MLPLNSVAHPSGWMARREKKEQKQQQQQRRKHKQPQQWSERCVVWLSVRHKAYVSTWKRLVFF